MALDWQDDFDRLIKKADDAHAEGDHESAASRYGQAAELVGSQRWPKVQALCLANQAIHLRQLGRHEDALKLYAKAIQLLRAHGLPDDLAAYLTDQANCLQQLGRREEALVQYVEAISLLRAHGLPDDLAKCLMNQANCLQQLGRREEALVLYAEAIPQYRAHGLPDDLALCLTNQATCLDGLGRREEALVQYVEAETLYRAHGLPGDLAKCLMNQANCLQQLGRREEALVLYAEAISLLRAHGLPDDLAKCLTNQATCLDGLGRHAEALVLYAEAIPLYRAHGLPDDLAKCLMNQAGCLSQLGRREEALVQYVEAETLYRAHGLPDDLAKCLMNQANCLQQLGRREEALVLYAEAISLLRGHGLPDDLAKCLTNQATCLDGLGRHAEALVLYAEAIPLYRAHGLPDDLALCLMNQAGCLSQLGRREEALGLYTEAAPLHEMRRSLAMCLVNQADCLDDLGRTEEALVLYAKAIPLLRAHGLPDDLAGGLMHQAAGLQKLGRQEEALALYAVAAELLNNEGPALDETRHDLAYNRSILNLNLRDLEAANRCIVEAVELADRLSSRLQDMTHRVLARAELTDTYRLATSITYAQGEMLEAFAYAQRGKGRTLTELLEARGDLSALDRRELVLTQQHESGQIDTEAYNVGVQHIQEQRLARRESRLGSDPQQPMTLADITASLRPGEELLDVMQVDDDGRLIAFLVVPDHRDIVWSGQVKGAVLTELVTTWEQARASWVEAATLLGNEEQRLKADRLVADLEVQQQKAAVAEQRLLAELGNLLLGDILPVLEEHGVTTLIISPDGLLHRLPLAALRIPDGRGAMQYLIERMAVQLVPTASSLAILRKPEAARITWPPALLAAAPFGGEATDSPDGPDTPLTMKAKASRSLLVRDLVRDDDDEQALPASRTEIEAITDILETLAGNGHHPVALYGKHATRDAVLTRLPAARILHLSTHGGHLRRDETLLEYRILLADKTQVTVSEVYDGTVSLKDVFAVCLSACNLGEVVLQGAEAIGFTQAFLQAGAGVILAPIWAVEDTATAVLMEAWYRQLASEARPHIAEAWRQAARQHIANSDYRHPYYWAGFLPSGDGALQIGTPA